MLTRKQLPEAASLASDMADLSRRLDDVQARLRALGASEEVQKLFVEAHARFEETRSDFSREITERYFDDGDRAVGSRCGAQSHGDVDDGEDPPVTCTRSAGHRGKHAGGTRGGTIEWP